MPSRKKLDDLLDKNDGLLLTREAQAQYITRQALYERVKKGELERIAFGVYLTPDAFDDEMYHIQLRAPKAIYSHGTALFLHDLTDVTPDVYTVTIPSNYNASSLLNRHIVRVFYIKADLHEIGIIEANSPSGRIIRTYDIERTICDICRSRNKMDIAMLTDALKRYAKRTDKDLTKLMQYARLFHVEKVIRTYMEVLL